MLLQGYRDELARVRLRRDACATQQTQESCTGDCHWQPLVVSDGSSMNRRLATATANAAVLGHCTLRTEDALLALVGEDCPLRTLFKRHSGCSEAADQKSCEAQERPDGLRRCAWRPAVQEPGTEEGSATSASGQCEAHPAALEFDMLLLLGAEKPSLLESLRESQLRCSQL